jgi:tetratricopeptide (TPR) repeat protein
MQTVTPRIGAEEPLSALGMIYSIMGDYQTAIHLAQEGLKFNLSRNDPGSAMLSYYVLTSAAFGQGNYQAAKQYSEQGLACTEQVNQRWFAAYIHIDLGHIARVMGDYAEAKKHYQACYDIRKDYNDPEGMAVSLKNLGRVALLENDAAKAKSLYEESLTIYKDLGDRGGLATALAGLGSALGALGDYANAQTNLRKALAITHEIRLTPLTLATVMGFGELLLRNGQAEYGIELLGLVLHHPASNHETKDEAKALLERQTNVDTAIERGKTLQLETVVAALLKE